MKTSVNSHQFSSGFSAEITGSNLSVHTENNLEKADDLEHELTVQMDHEEKINYVPDKLVFL